MNASNYSHAGASSPTLVKELKELKEEVKRLKTDLATEARKAGILTEKLAGSASTTAQIETLKRQVLTLQNTLLKETQSAYDKGFEKAMANFKAFKELMKV